jgi:hypothetical protein
LNEEWNYMSPRNIKQWVCIDKTHEY